MDAILKALVYLLVGLMLLTVNLWFARAVWHALREQPPVVIAPFQVVGKDDAGGRLGTTLATMLLARLGRIREELKASTQALRSARRGDAEAVIQTLDVGDPGLGWVPERLFAPLDLKMAVGGVEVGGLIAWIHRTLARDSLLQVALHYDGDQAVAVTHLGGSGEQSLWIRTRGGNDEVVSDIAYALTHRQFARHLPEVEALEPAEFKTLMSTLHRLAELNRQVARGRAAPQAYADLVRPLETLLERAPSWRDLVRLTASVAESAGDATRAIALYRRELELAAAGEPARQAIAARIERLTQRIAATTPARTDAPGLPPADRPPSAAAAYPLNLLGVASAAMSRSTQVAVVGGVPPGSLDADHYRLLADLAQAAAQMAAPPAADPGAAFMEEYTLSLVQAVRLVAPRARFLFAPVRAPRGATTAVELLRALERAVAEKPPILLVTLGPLEGPEFVRLLQKAVDTGVLVVIAAGNDPARPAPFAGHPLATSVLVVGAADAQGGEAKFSQRAPGIVWAPGEKIPVGTTSGRAEARAGTAYAAALAAGVAARVLAEHPGLDLPRLLDTLRETARPARPDGPPILNLRAALSRLAT